MQRGFLLDLFCSPDGMVLYVITGDGKRLRLLDHFTPSVYLAGGKRELSNCLRTLERWQRDVALIGPTERRDFWSGKLFPVFEIQVKSPFNWHQGLLNRLYRQHPDIEYFNADLFPEQHYNFDRQLIPCGWCQFEADRDGNILHIERDDNEWETDYHLPDLCTMELEGDGMLHGGRPHLDWIAARIDGDEYHYDGDNSGELLQSLNRLIEIHDPDIILTKGGDGFLFPLLMVIEQTARDSFNDPVHLVLDREEPPKPRSIRMEGRSYFSYGRVLYQSPDYPLYGRWHIDAENSFMVEHTGMHGLVEVSRVSKLPVQRIGRRSVGTGITSIQLDFAYREGFMIPWKKSVPEDWKTAAQLLATDRGGLVYQPKTGAYENVIEIDFVSMYPTIMSRFNVSPETVNCSCCHNDKVPEIGYTVCEKREGLVSRALAPIIEKRIRYKRIRGKARETKDEETAYIMDSRQTSLKWLLVCCFGYLGYRNARFGRIEAHESVCAFSRERLIRAREVCEERGFRVLHAIVDCFWCQRDPEHRHLGTPSRKEIQELCQAILEETELPIALEGVYRWIAFLPSRVNPAMPVPNRFFGRFEDGSVKMRGIEARRHDLPPFIRDVQKTCIDLLAEAENLTAYRARIPDLLKLLEECERKLWRGEIPRERLLITRSLSMDPDDYRSNNMIAIAARQAKLAGIPMRAGQSVSYLIVRQRDKDVMQRVCLAQLLQPETSYDPESYIRLLRRGFQTLLRVVGIDISEDPPPPPEGYYKKHQSKYQDEAVQEDLFSWFEKTAEEPTTDR